MSDEVSLSKGWSLEAYIAHNESMRDEMKDAVKNALISAKEAVQKAEAASEKRFEGVNEFRQTLSDQANTFIPRTEVEAAIKALNEKTNLVTSRMDRLEGRSGGNHQTWAYLIAGIGLLGTLVGIAGTIIAAAVLFKGG